MPTCRACGIHVPASYTRGRRKPGCPECGAPLARRRGLSPGAITGLAVALLLVIVGVLVNASRPPLEEEPPATEEVTAGPDRTSP
jgi:hypothetical protein